MNDKPVGGNGRFLVQCESVPYASFSERKEAEQVREMYSRSTRASGTLASKKTWTITDRGMDFDSGWRDKPYTGNPDWDKKTQKSF